MTPRRLGSALLFLFCTSTVVGAQDAPTEAIAALRRDINPENADRFELDLAIPTAPAFTVIGVTPEDVVDPSNARDFAVEVGSFFNEDGGLDPGLAISFKPYWLGLREITLGQYAEIGKLERVLARTQLSFATAESPIGDSDDVRAGVGFHTSLLNESDPRLDDALGACIKDAYDQHVVRNTGPALKAAGSATLERIQGSDVSDEERGRILIEEFDKLRPTIDLSPYNAAYESCQRSAADRYLKRRSWITGAGAAFLLDEGEVDETELDGFSLWTGYRWPMLGDGGDVTLFSKADIGQEVQFEDETRDATTVLAAIGAGFQSQAWKLRGNLSYNYSAIEDEEDDDFWRVSLTSSLRLRQDVWLEVAFGSVTDSDFEDEGFASAQLKIDLGRETLPNTPPME